MKKNILLIVGLVMTLSIFAQNPSNKFWHLEPFNKRGQSGIGLEEAKTMMSGKTPKTIIVAIADAGVDIYHPDLKAMLWTNNDEILNNGIDDDENGYVDDIYGWNFLGETTYDNLEITRQYALLNKKYELKSPADVTDNEEYMRYQDLKEIYLKKNMEAKLYFEFFDQMKQGFEFLEETYGTDITSEEIANHKSKSKYEQAALRILTTSSKSNKNFNYLDTKSELMSGYDHYNFTYNYGYNANFDPRAEKVGDDYDDVSETQYGNSKVYYGEKFSSHGTHVAGIVAADASNDFGARGICQSCRIMSIRTVPEGDERDKDVANSIRYAVDNGARIVNMSFGKSYAHNTEVVREAIRYAESENVLLIHAAGNDGKNNDLSNMTSLIIG